METVEVINKFGDLSIIEIFIIDIDHIKLSITTKEITNTHFCNISLKKQYTKMQTFLSNQFDADKVQIILFKISETIEDNI